MKLSLLTISGFGKSLKIGTALAAAPLAFGCAAVPATGGPGQGAVGALPTTAVPTTVPTTAVPTTVPTTAVPTTVPTTAVPTTVPTTAVPTTVPTTAVPMTAVPTTPGVPPLTYLGDVTQTTHDVVGGITVGPPHGTGPVVEWSTIGQTCVTVGSLCDSSLTGFVQLGNATSPQAGTIRSDGTIDPLMNDRRVYILEFRGMLCSPVGPKQPSPSPSPLPARDQSCEVKNYIDAQSGDILYTVSYASYRAARPQ